MLRLKGFYEHPVKIIMSLLPASLHDDFSVFALVEKCLQPSLFPPFFSPLEFMQNLNTYKGKDVLVTTLHTTVKVIFFVMYICKYEKSGCVYLSLVT